VVDLQSEILEMLWWGGTADHLSRANKKPDLHDNRSIAIRWPAGSFLLNLEAKQAISIKRYSAYNYPWEVYSMSRLQPTLN